MEHEGNQALLVLYLLDFVQVEFEPLQRQQERLHELLTLKVKTELFIGYAQRQ